MAAVLRVEQKVSKSLTLKFGSAEHKAHDLEDFRVAAWCKKPCLRAAAASALLTSAAHVLNVRGIIHDIPGLNLRKWLLDLLLQSCPCSGRDLAAKYVSYRVVE